MSSGDNFCYALVVNKILDILDDLEDIINFDVLENSIQEDLIICSKESNCIQIRKLFNWRHVDMTKILFLILLMYR